MEIGSRTDGQGSFPALLLYPVSLSMIPSPTLSNLGSHSPHDGPLNVLTSIAVKPHLVEQLLALVGYFKAIYLRNLQVGVLDLSDKS